MTRASGTELAADVLDELIAEVAENHPPVEKDAEEPEAELPKRVDVHALARLRGYDVRRGTPDSGAASGDGRSGITIPEFYSRKEERLAIAKGLTRHHLNQLTTVCDREGHDNCPSTEACEVARNPDEGVIEQVAAGLLMPADELRVWGEKLEWNHNTLAALFAVPVKTLESRSRRVRQGGV